MAISNIESSGFNSLFKASDALATKTVEVNVPSQKERSLKSSNRSLSSDNISLEGQNKLLQEKNEELTKNNRSLTQDLKQSQQENDIQKIDYSATEQPTSPETNRQQQTRSEEKASSADTASFDATVFDTTAKTESYSNNISQPAQAPVNSYAPTNTDLSGLEIGGNFSSYA